MKNLSKVIYFFDELYRLAEGNCMVMEVYANDCEEMIYLKFKNIYGYEKNIVITYDLILTGEFPRINAKTLFKKLLCGGKEV